jgi:multidrug efflux pump subunit AcrA (membrane-fusion protein)
MSATKSLILQMKSLDAQIAGLQAQMDQAETDLKRAEDLFSRGIAPRARLDEARTAFNVADNTMRARVAERSVVQQQLTEGDVLAPAAGRVLKVPLTVGTVILAGETVAEIAEENFVLRLRVPERHAGSSQERRFDPRRRGRTRRVGAAIRHHSARLSANRRRPCCRRRRRQGLGDYFVNKRVRVWVSAGSREAIVIPAGFITTRFGVDYVRVLRDGDAPSIRPFNAAANCRDRTCRTASKSCRACARSDRLVKP